MAESVTMWRSKNGKVFELKSEAETEDRAHEMTEVFNGLPDDVAGATLTSIAQHLASVGYRITNINPASA